MEWQDKYIIKAVHVKSNNIMDHLVFFLPHFNFRGMATKLLPQSSSSLQFSIQILQYKVLVLTLYYYVYFIFAIENTMLIIILLCFVEEDSRIFNQ